MFNFFLFTSLNVTFMCYVHKELHEVSDLDQLSAEMGGFESKKRDCTYPYSETYAEES